MTVVFRILLLCILTTFAVAPATIAQTQQGQGQAQGFSGGESNEPSAPRYDGISAETNMSDVLIRAYVPDDTQKLLAGDVIRFIVFEDEEAPQILRVKENGTVDFPYVGHVFVEGYTPKQVSDLLKYELERTYYYSASVFVGVEQSTQIRGSVQVIGEVQRPGEVLIPTNTDFRLSNAILKCGTTKYSKLSKIKVVRTKEDGGQEIYEVDARPIFEDGSKESDMILKDGDRIVIEKKGIVI